MVTPEQLQDSIDAFIFDLEENDKASKMKTLPLNYFMVVLRNGLYAPPANYESPIDKQLREYLEAKENQKKKREELEQRLHLVEFEKREKSLSTEQKLTLVPATDFAKPGQAAYSVQLKQFYYENVWPKRYDEISKSEGFLE